MSEPLACWNGEMVPVSQVSVPIYDGGFVLGTTVAEQIRTFGGQLFRLEEHLNRLARSLECVQVKLPHSPQQLFEWATQLAATNHAQLAPGDDLALCLFCTPGPIVSYAASPGMIPADRQGPSLVMHTYPLPFQNWCGQFDLGQRLVIVSVREVPTSCWPAALKCRSRMHYYLADLEAQHEDPGARALLLDVNGFVAEASTASVFLYRSEEGFVAPREEDILPSISLQTIRGFAEELGIPFVHRRIEPAEVLTSEEVLLCSTSPCVLPVTAVNKQPIGKGQPGPQWSQLMQCWNDRVGLDVVSQAKKFARRSS